MHLLRSACVSRLLLRAAASGRATQVATSSSRGLAPHSNVVVVSRHHRINQQQQATRRRMSTTTRAAAAGGVIGGGGEHLQEKKKATRKEVRHRALCLTGRVFLLAKRNGSIQKRKTTTTGDGTLFTSLFCLLYTRTLTLRDAIVFQVRAALKSLTADAMATQNAAITAHILQAVHLFNDEKNANTKGGHGGGGGGGGGEGEAPAVIKLGLYVHCAKLLEVDTTPLLNAALNLPNVKLYVPIVDMPSPSDASSSDAATTTTAAATPTPTMRFLRITSLEHDLEPKCMGIMVGLYKLNPVDP
jgi:hypothetical protein